MPVNEKYIPTSLHTNMKPLEYPDCIHLTEQCKCDILRVKKCIGVRCTFCQTADEKRRTEEKWLRMINAVQEEKQTKIADSYYGGKKPWTKQKRR